MEINRGQLFRNPYVGTVLEVTETRILVWWHVLNQEDGSYRGGRGLTTEEDLQNVRDCGDGTVHGNLQWIEREQFEKWEMLDSWEEVWKTRKKRPTRLLNILIDQKFLETCATGTLLGTIFQQNPESTYPEEVVLIFPQTTLGWRRKNGGPDQLIVNEFVIPLLIEDILHLKEHGVQVRVEMRDTPREES